MDIEIYSKESCSFCTKAKDLLKIKKLPYTEKNVSDPEVKEELLRRVFGVKTVPQIFINGKHIGGYSDLVMYIDQNL
jgi:glutaredoxin 3